MPAPRVVVIGAGMGGLVAAVLLAARGLAVTIVEAAAGPGGKMREIDVGGAKIDAGPTVFTMRWVFEDLFEEAGASLSDWVAFTPARTLARHFWTGNERLDLFSDIERSADAIAAFAGKSAADGYVRFCRRAQEIYETLRDPFICAARPSVFGLAQRVGFRRLPQLARISPFQTLWNALDDYFRDPRLRQLFGRYATYCGSSPFLAPSTLMLVAHVEREGVWLVEGGMHRLARALADLAAKNGASFRYGARARRIVLAGGRTSGVELADGQYCPADVVIMNGDVSALKEGLLGEDVSRAAAATPLRERSLSAVTWTVRTKAGACPLVRHNVFFSEAYREEFDDIFVRRTLPRSPTVYVCAQDRDADDDQRPGQAPERLLCLVNAPANGDDGRSTAEEMQSCEDAMFRRLIDGGLRIDRTDAMVRTTPAEFNRLFPATGGALYGRASHGWMASFARPAARTRVAGLYLAGGSVHPGPGVPMAALSGRQAARSVMADLASTARSIRAATSGGTSTR